MACGGRHVARLVIEEEVGLELAQEGAFFQPAEEHGLVHGPALQIRLMDVAGDAQTLAAALNHSAFNAANALGAWLGGVAIAAGGGWTSTGWVGALLGLGGLAVFTAALASERRTRAR